MPLPNGKAAIRPERLIMRTLFLLLAGVVSLVSSSAFAASYQRIGGFIVDPIQASYGGNHPYSGINLEPGANLFNANLDSADLADANLTNADLFMADLADSFGAALYNINTDFTGTGFDPVLAG